MADTGRVNPVQYKRGLNRLNYGHFGTAVYDATDQKWEFLRQDVSLSRVAPAEGDESSWTNISAPFKLLKGPVKVVDGSQSENVGLRSSRALSVKAVSRTLAQAGPGATAFTQTEAASNAGARIPGSQRFTAFGSAAVLGEDDARVSGVTAPVVAYTTGQDVTTIKFACLTRDSVESETRQGFPEKYEIPSIAVDAAASWTSFSGPVLQLYSPAPRSPDKGTSFIARSSAALTVFQPLLRSVAQPSVSFGCSPSTGIRLDPNPIMTLPCSSTGNQPIEDVVLWSDTPAKLAVIDIQGNWSIWSLKGRRSRGSMIKHRAKLVSFGSVYANVGKGKQKSSRSKHDDWYRMCWINMNSDSGRQLLICARDSVSLYDIHGSLLGSIDSSYGFWRANDVIMSVSEDIINQNSCYVLTNACLLWLSIRPRVVAHKVREGEFTLIASWNHFRGRLDHSLQLHVLDFVQNTCLLISSAASELVTVLIAHHPTQTSHGMHKISSPMAFKIPLMGAASCTNICFETTEAVSVNNTRFHSPNFVKLFLCSANGEINEATYEVIGDMQSDESNHKSPPKILLPPNQMRQYLSARYLDSESDADDFVVPDPPLGHVELEQTKADTTEDSISPNYSFRECDLSMVYHHFSESLRGYLYSQDIDLSTFLERITHRMSSTAIPYALVIDLEIDPCHVAEIEEASQLLEEWSRTLSTDAVNDTSTQDKEALGLNRINSKSLVETYRDIIDHWISRFPSTVPARSRINGERLSRQVGLEIYLSTLVYRRRPAILSQNIHQSADLRSQDLPSSYTSPAGDSVGPLSSLQPIDVNQVELTEDYSTPVLASYTSFSESSLRIPKSDTIADILAHIPLSIDADPAAYDWRQTELDIALAKDERLAADLDPRARRRVEKMARARKRQLEKQEHLKKVTFDNASSVPTVASSQLPIRNVQSSQPRPPASSQPSQDFSPLHISTQPERGVFGTREVRKSKPKAKDGKRVKGF